jgi:hypothetical protein
VRQKSGDEPSARSCQTNTVVHDRGRLLLVSGRHTSFRQCIHNAIRRPRVHPPTIPLLPIHHGRQGLSFSAVARSEPLSYERVSASTTPAGTRDSSCVYGKSKELVCLSPQYWWHAKLFYPQVVGRGEAECNQRGEAFKVTFPVRVRSTSDAHISDIPGVYLSSGLQRPVNVRVTMIQSSLIPLALNLIPLGIFSIH